MFPRLCKCAKLQSVISLKKKLRWLEMFNKSLCVYYSTFLLLRQLSFSSNFNNFIHHFLEESFEADHYSDASKRTCPRSWYLLILLCFLPVSACDPSMTTINDDQNDDFKEDAGLWFHGNNSPEKHNIRNISTGHVWELITCLISNYGPKTTDA